MFGRSDTDGNPENTSQSKLIRSLRERNLASEDVLRAMSQVQRELFVDAHIRQLAYDDNALPIGCGQTISQPTVVAMMTTALGIEPDNAVLEIGTGSGYQAAVISKLARHCHSVELHSDLAEGARQALKRAGISNVEVHVGDGSLGLPELAPFDRILVTAASPAVSDILLGQLRPVPGSKLVAPVGDQKLQSVVVVEWSPAGWIQRDVGSVRFVPLRGAAGWSNTDWKDS